MTAIIDYRAGNLTSVRNAFAAIGAEATVTSDPGVVAAADRVVFPGVGAARSAMRSLEGLGLVEAVRAAAASKPFLGICLGMQILFDRTEEDGGVDLLGILPGRVRRFPNAPGCKVPEMGWNEVRGSDPRGALPPSDEFYFVHSYYVEMNPCAVGRTEYAGVEFASAVRRGDLFATQFHPEKSGASGLALLKAFVEGAEGGRRC
ncbi:MAG: imidazole glycerol phosphate synthase subunit HisH [Kiritimatiellae bacterium]|nr:imidazole glycerol phosphate synthase subunit HisH [Kiritimatiellia bacterium]